MADFAFNKPYRSAPDRQKYDVYHTASKKKVAESVPAYKAARTMGVSTDDIKWAHEATGRVDTDKHTAVAAGDKFPGKYNPDRDGPHGRSG